MKPPGKPKLDLGVYLVLYPTIMTPVRSGKESIEDLLHQAIQGGITLVQVREKNCSNEEFLNLLRRAQPVLLHYNIPLIVNDRVDLALQSKVQGVHLGQSDLRVSEARKLLGPEAILGLSVENHHQALMAEKEDVNYLGVSSVFRTESKKELKQPWGPNGLKELKSYSRFPLVGIGGVNSHNARKVFQAGADGIAVISTLGTAPDPRASARRLREIADEFLRKKRGKL
jgi:thiamine-phosphate pyrophosphorylase